MLTRKRPSSLLAIIRSENSDAVEAAMAKHICGSATVHADENAAYDVLSALNKVERINHSVACSDVMVSNVEVSRC